MVPFFDMCKVMQMVLQSEKKLCSVLDCGKPYLAKGLCSAHWCRMSRHGSLELPARKSAEEKRRRRNAQNAIWMRKWRARNPDVALARERAWRVANTDKLVEINRKAGAKYRQRNPVKYRALKKAECIRNAATKRRYRLRHRAEAAIRSKKWTLKNPERALLHQRNGKFRRRQRERAGADPAGCLKKMAELRQAPHCHWCRNPIPRGKVTIDHVFPLSRGGLHVPANLVAACRPCNLRKSSKMPNEWLQEAA